MVTRVANKNSSIHTQVNGLKYSYITLPILQIKYSYQI